MRAFRRFALAAALACACLLAFAPSAFAKDYHIASQVITATVDGSGDMLVVDRRDVAFSGSFHWAQWDLETSGGAGIQVESVSLSGAPMKLVQGDISQIPNPGEYILSAEPDRVLVKTGFDVTDQTVPLDIAYRVKGAAKRYADTAELYWKFVGSEVSVPTDKLHVAIILPDGVKKSDVKAWAHGPLTGVVAIEDGPQPRVPTGRLQEPGAHVTLDVTDLPPNTFVEARILFPASAVPMAPLIDEPRAAVVEAEEAQLANEANAQRAAARAKLTFAYFGGLLVPLLLLGGVVLIWYRYGREYKPQQFPGGYFRDIPDTGLTPPLVGALWRMGSPDDADISASLMDLSLKGVVYMHPVTETEAGGFLGMGQTQKPTYELQLQRDKIGGMDPLERSLVAFLFENEMASDSFTIEDLRVHAKAHPQSFTRGLAAWKSEVTSKASDLGWIESESRAMQVLAFALAVAAVGATGLALFATGAPLLALGFVPGVAAFVVAFFVTRRSHAAVELYARYRGLRDYLRDFSRLSEKPPDAVILWEQYLVLAVVFGIAEQVIEQMRVAVPQVVNDPTFATAYWWASPAYGGVSPASALSSGFASAVSVANSQMSSASGGGGGFSGGGGGGGGGGGFSAG